MRPFLYRRPLCGSGVLGYTTGFLQAAVAGAIMDLAGSESESYASIPEGGCFNGSVLRFALWRGTTP